MWHEVSIILIWFVYRVKNECDALQYLRLIWCHKKHLSNFDGIFKMSILDLLKYEMVI
jgi:hypothetical protein